MSARIRPPRALTIPENASPTAGIALRSPDPLSPTIFHEPWWLDAVTGGSYEEIRIESGGACIGRLPFTITRRRGLRSIGMPMLTHFLGPAIDDSKGSETTRALKRISVARDMIERLPRVHSLWIKFHRGMTDTLAFQAAGFLNEVQFTCEIAPAAEDVLWSGLRDTARRVIRRAAEKLRVVEVQDPAAFIAFYESNLGDRGLRNNYQPLMCQRTIEACQSRGAGRVLAAVDADGTLQAGIFTIWDCQSEYYLMTTRKPGADNGAVSLLIWTAIQHAAARGLIFDLDGVNNAGDIQFLTRFGGALKPRYFVHRSTLSYKIAAKLRLISD